MWPEPRVCESQATEAAVILLDDRLLPLRRRGPWSPGSGGGEDHQRSGGQTRGLALAGEARHVTISQ